MTVEGVNLKTLGWLTLLGLPYTYKFTWSPVLDRYRLPGLWAGRRRGWLVVLMVLMAGVLLAMSYQRPSASDESLWGIALLAFCLVLLSATVGLAYESELFVSGLEPVTAQLGLGSLFSGVVILPLLGGVAEFVLAIRMASKNQLGLSVSVVMGSTLLVALLVVPVLVLLSPSFGHPLTLAFGLDEVLAVATAVLISNLVSSDGRSNWLEGVLLLATYVILAAGFAAQPLAIG